MYIVADHKINDPDKFWGAADPSIIPSGVTLHSTYPNADGSRAVCLWEADSVDAVRTLVDSMATGSSSNEFFEVSAEHAGTMGLPAGAASGA